jgi:subtilisin family serine protease
VLLGLLFGACAAPALAAGASAGPAPAVVPGAPTTGNLLVLLDRIRAGAGGNGSAVQAAAARLGARLAGVSVPEIGLITVRPPLTRAPAAFARSLRLLPGVVSVQVERRYVPRDVPNDPALSAPAASSGVVQWALAREGFYNAWSISHGDGARVGVIDTGVDAGHPDLASKLAAIVDQQNPTASTGPAGTDQSGHGTHVSSLACADTNNGIGIAGAGYNCMLVVEKTDYSDSSIASSIVDATNRHVQAINMSLGEPAGSSGGARDSEVRALNYAVAHKVVLVAAAADSPTVEQGDPASVLQPAGTGPNIAQGIGLDVTAADHGGARARFAGYGSEISLAAYGTFSSGGNSLFPCFGPPVGMIGAYPGDSTALEAKPDPAACRSRLAGDNRYATIAGTSMAAPQVAAAAAMMRVLNPYASLSDVITTLKRSAQRAPGAGWGNDLGWGILDAGAALQVIRRTDRLAPASRIAAPRLARHRVFLLRWSGHDQQRKGLIASGLARFNLYVRVNRGRARLIESTTGRSLRFHGRPGFRYAFYTIAIDRAGNRERHPHEVTTRVARGAA